MAYEYGDLKWSELSDKKRASVDSKSDHKGTLKKSYERKSIR